MNDENGTETAKGGRVRWPPYHWIQQQSEVSYSLFEAFWGAKYDEDDKRDYARYIRILELSKQGISGTAIEGLLGANNVRKYLLGKKRSFLTHLRTEHERLGTPRPGMKWLPLRIKPRGTPDKSWIEVPAVINDFKDIIAVIDQSTPTTQSFEMMTEFGYNSHEELLSDRVNMFGFAIGTMLGDASKPLKGQLRFPSRTVALTLSQAKPNSYRFGQYATLCLNASLGLSMKRIRDAPSSTGRYSRSECFRWLSPASPMIGWIFHDCMGYKDGEKATYHPARMDWIVRAPGNSRYASCKECRNLTDGSTQEMIEQSSYHHPTRSYLQQYSTTSECLTVYSISHQSLEWRFQQRMQLRYRSSARESIASTTIICTSWPMHRDSHHEFRYQKHS
jgi:hypothetical protein